MSFLRVSTVSANVTLADLGYTITHPATNFIITDQFSVEDVQNSEDLKAAIAAGDLTAQVLLDGVWTSVASGDYDAKDVSSAFMNLYEIANTVDNQRLVNGGDSSSGTQLHHHDSRYFTESELGSTTNGSSGASLIGVDQTNFDHISGANVQAALESIDDAFTTAVTLDNAYDNDSDGILDVDGTSKDLNFRSNNVNDILISRKSGVDSQNAAQLDVSADEFILGALTSGALAAINVRVKTNLIIDGNLQYTGTITDTTVNELNVTNANIRLRDGATGIPGADASILVERGTSGADANLRWDETADRWKAGLEGSDQTIALLEANETVTGIWDFQGAGTTSPSFYYTTKTAAPSTNLGTSGQTPTAVINSHLCIYDKTNSRNKWLSVSREFMTFTGRDSTKNTNEYARIGLFTSNQAGVRLIQDATLVGISVQAGNSASWNVRVRKNGVVTNLASLTVTTARGAHAATYNIDFAAGDEVQVYIDGTNIARPVIRLEFAYRY